MSDTGHEGRAWRHYVQDMIDSARRAVAYTQGKTQADFVADALTYDATLRNLKLIGEAATHIPNRVREAHPEIPWRAIVGGRNRFVHGYGGMNDDLIWSMIRDAVPKLLPVLQHLLDTTGKDST